MKIKENGRIMGFMVFLFIIHVPVAWTAILYIFFGFSSMLVGFVVGLILLILNAYLFTIEEEKDTKDHPLPIKTVKLKVEPMSMSDDATSGVDNIKDIIGRR